jgi:hypothetical protein
MPSAPENPWPIFADYHKTAGLTFPIVEGAMHRALYNFITSSK